jgi:hypothetical protein
MSESLDNWPQFTFYPGPPKCVHAIGVISSCYNSFERILFKIYMHHLSRKKFPQKLCELYYLSLAEDHRLQAIKFAFEALEKNDKVRDRVFNLLKYFEWCSTVRNAVLHGEVYPTLLLDKNDLKLVKRKRKRSSEVEYHSFTLAKLRDYAERIEAGREQAARINVHLRYRATPAKRRSVALRAHGYEPLPKILEIPDPLEGSAHPQIGLPHLIPILTLSNPWLPSRGVRWT